MTDTEREEFLRLIAAFQDDCLSEDELAHLDQALQEDAEKRQLFIEVQERSTALTELLREDAFSKTQDADSQTVGVLRGRVRLFVGPIVAVTTCIALMVWLQPRPAAVSGEGAAITYVNQGHWGGPPDEAPVAGTLLHNQVLYRLQAGSVRLQMEAGAIVSIAAPASFRVVDASTLELKTGKLTARLPDPSSDLLVRAGELEIRDLGTAFGLTAGSDGKLDVAVFDGSVSVRSVDASAGVGEETFAEGQAFASAGAAHKHEEIPYEPGKYQDIWPLTIGINEASAIIDFVPPGPRPPLESLAHDHKLFLIPERLNLHVDEPLVLDLVGAGKSWPSTRHGQHKIDPTRAVSSYLLVYEPENSAFGIQQTLSGSISFQHPILGVAVSPRQLRRTDRTFGIPGIDYDSFAGRRLEHEDTEDGRLPADSLRISDDGRQLYFHLHVGALTDHIRVLVDDNASLTGRRP